jgi:hypothetical protein
MRYISAWLLVYKHHVGLLVVELSCLLSRHARLLVVKACQISRWRHAWLLAVTVTSLWADTVLLLAS